MPEPITTLTVGAIAVYLADKVAGKAIGDSSAALWGKIKQWFKGDEILSILEKAPDSATQQGALAAKLDELIKQQPETLKEIESLLNQLPYGMVSNVANITGVGNLAFQNITNSTINASITIGKSGEYREHKEKLDLLKELFDKTLSEDTQKRLDLSQKINEQEGLVESFKQDVLKLAETFNKIELNSERLQKAKVHFDRGEITEARVLLEDAEEERSDFVSHALGKQKEYEKKILPGLQNAAAEYLILAQTTALNFESPSRFEDTCSYYKQSIVAFASFDNLIAYAYFLQVHLQHREAIDIYQRIKIDFVSGLSQKRYAMMLNNLATLHWTRNEFDSAEKEYAEALAIRRERAEKNPQAYLPEVAMTLNNLANLHNKRNEHEAAEAEYTEALAIGRELAKKNPQANLPSVARTLNNLAVLHSNRNEHEAAEAEYKEALAIGRELAEKNPRAYLPDVATTLNNMAVLHRARNEHEMAEKEYTEALTLHRELAEKNPQAYLPDVALTLNNLANLHSTRDEYEVAEVEYTKALAIYRELAEKNPQAYLAYVAATLNNLAGIYYARNEYDEVERIAGEALTIRRELAEKNPRVYLPNLAMTLKNLALFYQKSKPDRKRSVEKALEAVKILLSFVEKVPAARQDFYLAISILKEWGMNEEEIAAAIES